MKVQCSSSVGDDLRTTLVISYSWCHDTCSKGVRCEAGISCRVVIKLCRSWLHKKSSLS